jgi:hypothetical protein
MAEILTKANNPLKKNNLPFIENAIPASER